MKTEQEIEVEFERIDQIEALAGLVGELRPKYGSENFPWDISDEYQFNYAISELRLKGFVVRIENGLDGTWEATFYKPDRQLQHHRRPIEDGMFYAPGDTMGIAVLRSALKVLFVEEKP